MNSPYVPAGPEAAPLATLQSPQPLILAPQSSSSSTGLSPASIASIAVFLSLFGLAALGMFSQIHSSEKIRFTHVGWKHSLSTGHEDGGQHQRPRMKDRWKKRRYMTSRLWPRTAQLSPSPRYRTCVGHRRSAQSAALRQTRVRTKLEPYLPGVHDPLPLPSNLGACIQIPTLNLHRRMHNRSRKMNSPVPQRVRGICLPR